MRRRSGLVLSLLLAGCQLLGEIEERTLEQAQPSGGGGAAVTSTGAAGAGGSAAGGAGAAGGGGAGGAGAAGGGGAFGGGGTGGGEPCTFGSCGRDLGCDPVSLECVPCGQLSTDAGEAFVDAAGPTWGTGTAICPVRTITEGISLLSASTATERTVNIASGLYDDAHGETFPIAPPANMHLSGAGAGVTVVRGSGPAQNPLGTFDVVRPTLSAGSPTGNTSVAGLTLEPQVETLNLEYVGVFCDEGNGLPLFLPAIDPPDPTLELVGVHIGPGYGVGVVASSRSTSACNVSVRASTLQGNLFGVWAAGCGFGSPQGGAPTTAVVARVGAPGEGNAIHDHQTSALGGVGVLMWDCVGGLVVEDNTFTSNDQGVAIGFHDALDGSATAFVAIESNSFSFHKVTGVTLALSSTVDELNGNEFHDNIDSGAGFGTGLVLGPGPGFNYPKVRRARANVFRNNEIGIDFRDGEVITAGRISDFGSASESGANELACNVLDVVVRPNEATAGLVVPFVGNRFDHDPPTTYLGSSPPGGVDITRLSAQVPQLDLTLSEQATVSCP